MPRLPQTLLKHAFHINPLLVPLIRITRNLRDAQNELRWLTEHAFSLKGHRRHTWLWRACSARERGYPLQYLLGSEYFDDLELIVHKGVLIPRGETAEITSFLASRLSIVPSTKAGDGSRRLRVLDLCTGSGCMALLFAHKLLLPTSRQRKAGSPEIGVGGKRKDIELEILGVDKSSKALGCAQANLERLQNITQQLDPVTASIIFLRGNILDQESIYGIVGNGEWDVVLANPPYISPSAFFKDTQRSVRGFEPRSALVPPSLTSPIPTRSDSSTDHTFSQPAAANVTASSQIGSSERREDEDADVNEGDLFYHRILAIAEHVKAKIVLFEVGDMAQAMRVASIADPKRWNGQTEIWRDGVSFDGSSSTFAPLPPPQHQFHTDSVREAEISQAQQEDVVPPSLSSPTSPPGTEAPGAESTSSVSNAIEAESKSAALGTRDVDLEKGVRVIGPVEGHGRAVLFCTSQGREWLWNCHR